MIGTVSLILAIGTIIILMINVKTVWWKLKLFRLKRKQQRLVKKCKLERSETWSKSITESNVSALQDAPNHELLKQEVPNLVSRDGEIVDI